jgi:hypothetical protein
MAKRKKQKYPRGAKKTVRGTTSSRRVARGSVRPVKAGDKGPVNKLKISWNGSCR